MLSELAEKGAAGKAKVEGIVRRWNEAIFGKTFDEVADRGLGINITNYIAELRRPDRIENIQQETRQAIEENRISVGVKIIESAAMGDREITEIKQVTPIGDNEQVVNEKRKGRKQSLTLIHGEPEEFAVLDRDLAIEIYVALGTAKDGDVIAIRLGHDDEAMLYMRREDLLEQYRQCNRYLDAAAKVGILNKIKNEWNGPPTWEASYEDEALKKFAAEGARRGVEVPVGAAAEEQSIRLSKDLRTLDLNAAVEAGASAEGGENIGEVGPVYEGEKYKVAVITPDQYGANDRDDHGRMIGNVRIELAEYNRQMTDGGRVDAGVRERGVNANREIVPAVVGRGSTLQTLNNGAIIAVSEALWDIERGISFDGDPSNGTTDADYIVDRARDVAVNTYDQITVSPQIGVEPPTFDEYQEMVYTMMGIEVIDIDTYLEPPVEQAEQAAPPPEAREIGSGASMEQIRNTALQVIFGDLGEEIYNGSTADQGFRDAMNQFQGLLNTYFDEYRAARGNKENEQLQQAEAALVRNYNDRLAVEIRRVATNRSLPHQDAPTFEQFRVHWWIEMSLELDDDDIEETTPTPIPTPAAAPQTQPAQNALRTALDEEKSAAPAAVATSSEASAEQSETPKKYVVVVDKAPDDSKKAGWSLRDDGAVEFVPAEGESVTLDENALQSIVNQINADPEVAKAQPKNRGSFWADVDGVAVTLGRARGALNAITKQKEAAAKAQTAAPSAEAEPQSATVETEDQSVFEKQYGQDKELDKTGSDRLERTVKLLESIKNEQDYQEALIDPDGFGMSSKAQLQTDSIMSLGLNHRLNLIYMNQVLYSSGNTSGENMVEALRKYEKATGRRFPGYSY